MFYFGLEFCFIVSTLRPLVAANVNLCSPSVVAYCSSRGQTPLACASERCPGIVVNDPIEEGRFNQEILRLLNEIRSKPIFGVTAANMRLLKWDAELAQMASVAAHSICLQRVIERKCEVTPSHLEPIGSTELALSADFKIELDAATVIDKWFTKRTLYNVTGALLPYNGDKSLKPVAQILSARTTSVGCAYIQAPTKGLQALAVCKYAPAGAQPGVNTFEVGWPASLCPAGSTVYASLCS